MARVKFLWLAVTADEFEFPIYIEDTARELGEKLGITSETVRTYEFRGSSGKTSGRKVVKIPND